MADTDDRTSTTGDDQHDDAGVAEARAASRADGRPPEEAESDDPTAQSDSILLESEARLQERSADSDERR